MDDSLQSLLAELEHFGEVNDRETEARPCRMLNITRDTGEFLLVLCRAMSARRVLEIGTSNGYSTLWLALAVQSTGGMVTTVEHSDYKAGLARKNFTRSGLGAYITLVEKDAGLLLQSAAEDSYDLIFLDAERSFYVDWWPNLKRVLRPGGLMVVDNALSHAEEMAPLVGLIKADADLATSLVPLGNGEFLAVKADR
jgi:predicted O-methyltransferase YrrM